MNYPVSYCGLMCQGCPIYWATHETDEKRKVRMKREIAKLSNKIYGTKFKAKDITNCDGCRAETGILFPGCNQCYIRNCARKRDLPNCAYCSDYICDPLEKFFVDNPESKSRLDFIRSMI